MEEFINIVIFDKEEQDVSVHYTQVYQYNKNWYWNDKEIVDYPTVITDQIEKIQKLKKINEKN